MRLMNPPSSFAVSSASGESYGMFILTSASAQPMTPSPMRLVARLTSRSLSSGKLLTLITSSKKRTEVLTVSSRESQSMLPSLT